MKPVNTHGPNHSTVFAVLRLGAAMVDDLPSVSATDAYEPVTLDKKEGWIRHVFLRELDNKMRWET